MNVLLRNKKFVFVSLLIVAAGCQHGPRMYKVRGKIAFTGGAVPHAGVNLVNFTPTPDSKAEMKRPATGAIAPDGSFEMFTRVNGDGVYAGEYAVTFNIAKGAMDPTLLIPRKYIDIHSPPYKITVDHNISDLDYTIDLSPGGGASGTAKTGG